MGPEAAFAAIGMVILIGFVGQMVFARFKVPDLLILIILGFAFGPVARCLGYELVSKASLESIAPYFAAFALIIILFDGGLNLNYDKVLHSIGSSAFLATIGFFASSAVIAALAYLMPYHNPIYHDASLSLIMGTILGGSCSTVAIPLISKLSIREETKTLLSLEAVLTDVLCIVIIIILIGIREENASFLSWETTKGALGGIAASFSIAIVLGAVLGTLFLRVLRWLQGAPYAFMLTIAALFLVYAVSQYIGGSGPVSALVFGLILSNKDEISRILKMKGNFIFEENVKQFHSELSFFIRTFFFVYIGLVFSEDLFLDGAGDIRWWAAAAFVSTSLVMAAGLFATRLGASGLTVLLDKPSYLADWSVIAIMLPRGLAAAVLASIPGQMGVADAEESGFLVAICFLIILVTCVITSVGIVILERSKKRSPPPPPTHPR